MITVSIVKLVFFDKEVLPTTICKERRFKIRNWCSKNFDSKNFSMHKYHIIFKNEDDAIFFKLRFSINTPV